MYDRRISDEISALWIVPPPVSVRAPLFLSPLEDDDACNVDTSPLPRVRREVCLQRCVQQVRDVPRVMNEEQAEERTACRGINVLMNAMRDMLMTMLLPGSRFSFWLACA